MSRASVRSAIADFFADPPVEGLSVVKRSPPRIIGADEFYSGLPAGSSSGAVGMVHIEDQDERRSGMGGVHGGTKERIYRCWLYVLWRSREADFEAAYGSLDALLENLTARLQADRTLGGRVFQAGEGDTLGAPDLHIVTQLPRRIDNEVHSWTGIRFTVVDFLLNT